MDGVDLSDYSIFLNEGIGERQFLIDKAIEQNHLTVGTLDSV